MNSITHDIVRTRIVHLSSAHPRYDIRIFTKQCCSLAARGYQVSLVVADGLGDEQRDGVQIVDAGACAGRLQRMSAGVWRVYRAALALQGDVYQLHDPELLPVGLLLKREGKRVVFDAHEDVPLQLLCKPYLARPLRRVFASAYGWLQKVAAHRFDGIVTATPSIAGRFAPHNSATTCVCNYPLLAEFQAPTPWDERNDTVCYLGDITAIRGAHEMVRAMGRVRGATRLNLAGCAAAPELLGQLQREPGWQRVNTLGQVDRKGVRRLLAQSRAGLVTLHPTANYLDSLPIKMFEYMAAGIPVIASNFPAWRAIIDTYQCGVCVDPLDPDAIAGAIDSLDADPLAAQRMGTNGRTAVLTHFHWEREFKSLLALYAKLLDREPAAASVNAVAPQRGDTTKVALWHKYRALLSELRRMPRVRLQFQTHLNPAEVRATYLSFTKPHPRFPLVRHKAIGVALVNLRQFDSPERYLAEIGGKNRGASLAQRARKRGYTVAQIDRNAYVDEIHAINTSLTERQGRPMSAAYTSRTQHFDQLPNYRYYGVLAPGGKLVAYANMGYYGDFAALAQLMGYRNNDGAMHLLLVDLVSSLITEKRARFLMYDTFFGASAGMQAFKRMLGFQPHYVSYELLD
ncbi:glycosyltransferase family 4 protein [Telluria antibiotica]|nr:glycosyltransferase family 4 protein [Telluria antibiotica]